MKRLLTAALFALCSSAPAQTDTPLISRGNTERFTRLLHLSPDQHDAALSLHSGYAAAYETALREYRDKRALISQPKNTPEILEALDAARTTYLARALGIEQAFLSDLQSLCDRDQADSWPSVERARRRQRFLPGVVSGESIDLVELLDSLNLPADEMSLITEPLAAYELDLDRALLQKAATLKEEDPFNTHGEYSALKVMKRTSHTRDIGLTIRDLNETHAHRIEAALPESLRTTFRTAFQLAAFPGVYSPTPGSRLLAAATKLADLSPTQREALESLRTSHDRDLAAANAQHERAVKDAETAKLSVVMPTESGGTMQVYLGTFDSNPVLKARSAKRELDTRLKEHLSKALSLAQRQTLPRDPTPKEQVGMDDTAVMIWTDP